MTRKLFNITLLLLLLLLTTLSFSATAKGKKEKKAEYIPKEFAIEVWTKGFPGAKAKIIARLDAPIEYVWQALLDSNNHANRLPRMEQSFCMSEPDVLESKKDGLRNGATVKRRYKKRMCDPHELRQKGKVWTYYLFQEIDYPFPLADRWIMAETNNDESQRKKGHYQQTGHLIYGRQDVFEFQMSIQRHSKYRDQTRFEMFIWSDPGGFITDWMVREATEYIAPVYLQVLEEEAQKWAEKTKQVK